MRSRSRDEFEALRDPARDYELPSTVGQADWKAHVSDVLGAVDDLLAKHDLEVVLFDTGTDTYAFKVEKRSET